MLNDIDYEVVQNKRTGTKHLSITKGTRRFIDRSTVCGLPMKSGSFSYVTIKLQTFWKSRGKCKNCSRAAKR